MNKIYRYIVFALFAVFSLTAYCGTKTEKLVELAVAVQNKLDCPKTLVPDALILESISSDAEGVIFNGVVTNEVVAKAVVEGNKELMRQSGIAALKSIKDMLYLMEHLGFIVKIRYFNVAGEELYHFNITAEDLKNSKPLTAEGYIDNQVANMKGQLPVRVDELTVLSDIYREGVTMVYVYDCDVDMIAEGVTVEEMKGILLPGLGTLARSFKRLGVSIRYIYKYQGKVQLVVNITTEEM